MSNVEFFGRGQCATERIAAVASIGVGIVAMATTRLSEQAIQAINAYVPDLDANNGYGTFALGLAAVCIGIKKLQNTFPDDPADYGRHASAKLYDGMPYREPVEERAVAGIKLIAAHSSGEPDERVYDITCMGGGKRYIEDYGDRDYMRFIPGEVLHTPR